MKYEVWKTLNCLIVGVTKIENNFVNWRKEESHMWECGNVQDEKHLLECQIMETNCE